MTSRHNVLFMGANPSGTDNIQVRNELRALKALAEKPGCPFNITEAMSIQTDELQSILSQEFTIIHISAHGSPNGEITLSDPHGDPSPTRASSIAEILKQTGKRPRLGIVSACQSRIAAHELAASCGSVIGTNEEITSDAAIDFTKRFYSFLATGNSVAESRKSAVAGMAPTYGASVADWFSIEHDDRDESCYTSPFAPPRTIVASVFVVQDFGAPNTDVRRRADRVFEELILPTCKELGFDAFRSHQLNSNEISEPIVSALNTARLVIADIGGKKLNVNVMTEVGFRLATGRPLVLIAEEDSEANVTDLSSLIPHKQLTLIDDGTDNLVQRCREALRDALGWDSNYPITDISIHDNDLSNTKFVYANQLALKLYGLSDAESIIDVPSDELDKAIMDFMPPEHAKQFAREQEQLLKNVLVTRKSNAASWPDIDVRATYPLYFTRHKDSSYNGQCFWPVLTQLRWSADGRTAVLRVAFLRLTDWLHPAKQVFDKVVLADNFRPPIQQWQRNVCIFHHPKDFLRANRLAGILNGLKIKHGLDIKAEYAESSQGPAQLEQMVDQSELVVILVSDQKWMEDDLTRLVTILKARPDKPVLIGHSGLWEQAAPSLNIEFHMQIKERQYLYVNIPDDLEQIILMADADSNLPLTRTLRIINLVKLLLQQRNK